MCALGEEIMLDVECVGVCVFEKRSMECGDLPFLLKTTRFRLSR